MWIENGAEVNERGAKGNHDALYAATSYGISEVVQHLSNRRADPNAEGEKYGSALKVVARQGHADIVEMLIRKGGPRLFQHLFWLGGC